MTDKKETMETVFSSLEKHLKTFGIDRTSLPEFCSQMIEAGHHAIAYSFLKHATDILRTTPKATSLQLMTECYRRAFFDAELAAQYGTDHVLAGDPQRARSYVDTIVACAKAESSGSVIHTEAGAMQ